MIHAKKRYGRSVAVAISLSLLVAGCETTQQISPPASADLPTKTTFRIEQLPLPVHPVDVAVYELADLTGQAKPNDSFAEYSRAVTQGGAQILVDVLKSAGDGEWFRVVERTGLKNLVQERTLIENTQRAYGKGSKLPPVRFAGMILEGAIVGYDSNETTGGAGARYLGIGADAQHRSDLVTVALRAISVQTGEVLVSTTATRQVYSRLVRAGVYKFVVPTELLEVEAGYSHNDPGQLAVREALELAVYSLVVKGVESDLWKLRDPGSASKLISDYSANYHIPRPVIPPKPKAGA